MPTIKDTSRGCCQGTSVDALQLSDGKGCISGISMASSSSVPGSRYMPLNQSSAHYIYAKFVAAI
jgi:hypothetical protein